MRKLSLIICMLFTITAFCQVETPATNVAAFKFQVFYNNQNFDSIFSMFSPAMQQALPLHKTKEFFSDLFLQAGLITKKEFIKYNETFALYKTNFEKAIFAINISVDNSMVNGFFVVPFTDENIPRPKRNSIELSLPFKAVWTVVWGGDTEEQNYHIKNTAQKNAFDILMKDEKGMTHKNDG